MPTEASARNVDANAARGFKAQFSWTIVDNRVTKSFVNNGLACDLHRSRLLRFALSPWASSTRCSVSGSAIGRFAFSGCVASAVRGYQCSLMIAARRRSAAD
jgi:hypothetical protein